MEKTLRTLRDESGMELQQVFERLKEVAPHAAPRYKTGIQHWENRGTRDRDVIAALALTYGLPEDVVDNAALQSRITSTEIKKPVRTLVTV